MNTVHPLPHSDTEAGPQLGVSMLVHSPVAALRVANEAFLVSSTIERCPKIMMIRELVVNAIEARGEISEVGERKRRQRGARIEGRSRLVAELVALDREEAALLDASAHERG